MLRFQVDKTLGVCSSAHAVVFLLNFVGLFRNETQNLLLVINLLRQSRSQVNFKM